MRLTCFAAMANAVLVGYVALAVGSWRWSIPLFVLAALAQLSATFCLHASYQPPYSDMPLRSKRSSGSDEIPPT